MIQVLLQTLQESAKINKDARAEQRAKRKRKRHAEIAAFLAALAQPGGPEEEDEIRQSAAQCVSKPTVLENDKCRDLTRAAELLLARIDEIWKQVDPSVLHQRADSRAIEDEEGDPWLEDVSRSAAQEMLAKMENNEDVNWEAMEDLRRLGVLPLPQLAKQTLNEKQVKLAIAAGSALRQLLGDAEFTQLNLPEEPPLPEGARALAELFDSESSVLELLYTCRGK